MSANQTEGGVVIEYDGSAEVKSPLFGRAVKTPPFGVINIDTDDDSLSFLSPYYPMKPFTIGAYVYIPTTTSYIVWTFLNNHNYHFSGDLFSAYYSDWSGSLSVTQNTAGFAFIYCCSWAQVNPKTYFYNYEGYSNWVHFAITYVQSDSNYYGSPRMNIYLNGKHKAGDNFYNSFSGYG